MRTTSCDFCGEIIPATTNRRTIVSLHSSLGSMRVYLPTIVASDVGHEYDCCFPCKIKIMTQLLEEK